MNFINILIAAGLVGGVALLIGLLLGLAGCFFRVKVDEKEAAVREVLPGNNCGACGYPGCDGLAKAIANGTAPVTACPVGGVPVAEAVSAVMGVKAGEMDRRVAFVRCGGTCDKAVMHANYYGVEDCRKASVVPGKGAKACVYGCMGFGTCVKACPFDAIHLVNGVAVVDKEACKACEKCVAVCPNNLIEMVPYGAAVEVGCSSPEKGKEVRAVCQTGCIACGICVKNCPEGAITLENGLARIDQSKCTGCGICAEKCPTKAIKPL